MNGDYTGMRLCSKLIATATPGYRKLDLHEGTDPGREFLYLFRARVYVRISPEDTFALRVNNPSPSPLQKAHASSFRQGVYTRRSPARQIRDGKNEKG